MEPLIARYPFGVGAAYELGDPGEVDFPAPPSEGSPVGVAVALEVYFPERGGIVLDADGGHLKLYFSESEKARLLASALPSMTSVPILAIFTAATQGGNGTPEDNPGRDLGEGVGDL